MYVVNGIAMLLTFFLTRNVFGLGALQLEWGCTLLNMQHHQSVVLAHARLATHARNLNAFLCTCSHVSRLLPSFVKGTQAPNLWRHLAIATLGLSHRKRPVEWSQCVLVSLRACAARIDTVDIRVLKLFAKDHGLPHRRVSKMASGAAKLLLKRRPSIEADGARKEQ